MNSFMRLGLLMWLMLFTLSCATQADEQGEKIASFSCFMRNFTSDADYQMQHICFPLGELTDVVAVESDGESSSVEFGESLWAYKEIDCFVVDPWWERGGFSLLQDGRLHFECCGVLMDYKRSYTFEQRDGEWMLVEAFESHKEKSDYKDIEAQVRESNHHFLRRRAAGKGFIPYVKSGADDTRAYTSQRKLTRGELKGASDSLLQLMRDEILARKGQVFSDARRRYFMAQKWYMPLFDDATPYLSRIESRNVALIDELIDK